MRSGWQLEACMQKYWRASRNLARACLHTGMEATVSHARRLRTKSQSSLSALPDTHFISMAFCRACTMACMTACMRALRHSKQTSFTNVRAHHYMPESIMHACCGLHTNKCLVGKVRLNDHKLYECVLSGSRESTLNSTDKKYQTTYSH